MNKLLVLLFFLSSGYMLCAQGKLSFASEYIDFSLDTNYFTINGIYTFVNKTDRPIQKGILFPFSVNTISIDSIRIINMNTLEPIRFSKKKESVQFSITMSALDSVDVNIFYRQPLATKNSYILKTTKSWGEPIKEAIYTLSIDDKIKVASISLEPDSIIPVQGNNVYYWNKHNFSPSVDFEIVLDYD